MLEAVALLILEEIADRTAEVTALAETAAAAIRSTSGASAASEATELA